MNVMIKNNTHAPYASSGIRSATGAPGGMPARSSSPEQPKEVFSSALKGDRDFRHHEYVHARADKCITVFDEMWNLAKYTFVLLGLMFGSIVVTLLISSAAFDIL